MQFTSDEMKVIEGIFKRYALEIDPAFAFTAGFALRSLIARFGLGRLLTTSQREHVDGGE
jgi:hypothetical protein